MPELKFKIEAGVKGKEDEITKEEEAAKSPTPVKVGSKKERKLSKKKGRIHEIRYMDTNGRELSNEDEGSDLDDVEVNENLKKGSDELKKGKKKKVKKSEVSKSKAAGETKVKAKKVKTAK